MEGIKDLAANTKCLVCVECAAFAPNFDAGIPVEHIESESSGNVLKFCDRIGGFRFSAGLNRRNQPPTRFLLPCVMV